MKTGYIILMFLFFGMAAQAQQGPVFSLGGSTMGATIEAGYRLGPRFGLRGLAGYGKFGISPAINGTPTSGTAAIGGVGLLADMYFGSGARLSLGGIVPNYKANLALNGTMTANGTTFNNVNISGTIDTMNNFAPMASIGYEKPLGKNWGISADIGAIYTGGFSISATDNSAQIPQTDLDTELASSNANLGKITVLPFVKLSVSFAF